MHLRVVVRIGISCRLSGFSKHMKCMLKTEALLGASHFNLETQFLHHSNGHTGEKKGASHVMVCYVKGE